MTEQDGIHTGTMIKDMRKRRGLTMKQLARMTFRTESAISTMEGQANCRMSTFVEMAKAMGYEIVIRPKEKK